MDLCVPRMLVGKSGGDLGSMSVSCCGKSTIGPLELLHLGIRIIERDMQRVVGKLLEVLFAARIAPHTFY